MAGGLSIEVEEDVQLVENAAAASLFSPGVWVQRPQRTPALARDAAHEAGLAGQRGTAAAAAAGRRGQGLGSPLADPDLAYLNIADERESEEKEYQKQDSEHMEALEEAYGRLLEQNRAAEQHLSGVVAAVSDVAEENRTIKQLLAMLQVTREDFIFNPQQTIASQQGAIGLRLLRNLDGSPQGAPPQQQQQQQQGAAPLPAAQQRQQEHRAVAEPMRQLQQQYEQQFGGVLLPIPPPLSAGPSPLDLASPGCLLPLSTPSMLRTVSPRIGAFRFDAQQAGDPCTAPPLPPTTAVPASPYDFPAESQIAAAALTAKQGDTAAALLTLLDKAIEGRKERQQQAQQAPQQGQQAARQAEQQPSQHQGYRV